MTLKIGLVGAESTGKSTLGKALASQLGGEYIEEYARTYIGQLGKAYTYDDVCHIAKHQIDSLTTDYSAPYIFFDTELIITKVWFDVKYGRRPDWFDRAYSQIKCDKYLLLMPDIAFAYDPLRENPDKREELTTLYEQELCLLSANYTKITGQQEERLINARNAIRNLKI